MLHLILGLCFLPALIAALVIIRKVNGEREILRERLEAALRFPLQQARGKTVALLTKELHRLEVENTLLRSRLPVGEEIAA